MKKTRLPYLFSCLLFFLPVWVSSLTATAQTLVWSDEFDSTALDRKVWTFDLGNSGFGNGELQTYTANPENVQLSDGDLVIQAVRDGDSFTSARLKTQGRFSFQYGRLEARIKLPNVANGLWPAFWLMGDNYGTDGWPRCGEIDVMEVGYRGAIENGTVNRSLSGAVHWWHETGTWSDWLQADANADTTLSENFYEDYHIFGMNWYPDRIELYIDNPEQPYFAIDITPEELSEFRNHAFLLLNLAVGGWNFVEITDPAQITAPFPAQMRVDYVRVYDLGDTDLKIQTDEDVAGNFGVYTETAPVASSINLGTDAALYVWNNMTATSTEAWEGQEALAFDVAAGDWYGMGFAATLSDFNLPSYSNGSLKFHMKTTSSEPISIGLKSSGAGEGWVNLVSGTQDFGLQRDGQWHEVSIPLNLFANVDFSTINQVFMIKGEAPADDFTLALDNIYWVPDGEVPAPTGTFALFSETSEADSHFELDRDGKLYVWENTLQPLTGAPYEGENSLAYTSTPGLSWFGLAFTPFVKYDLSAYATEEAYLHLALKTSSEASFSIGMKSGNLEGVGQQWLAFENGNDPYGFQRDGQWHEVIIPMQDFSSAVDLTEVSQLFELLGTEGPISDIEIDDIYFAPGSLSVEPTATQSSTLFDRVAERAIDGNTSGDWRDQSLSLTQRELNPWWQYDRGQTSVIESIDVWNRTDLLGLQLHGFLLYVSEEPFTTTDPSELRKDGNVFVYRHRGLAGCKTTVPVGQQGRYVMIQLRGKKMLSLAEVVIRTGETTTARQMFASTKPVSVPPDTPEVGLYPNPVVDEASVYLDQDVEQPLRVLDVQGRLIMTIPPDLVNRKKIDMSRLKPGLYTIQAPQRVLRFIKQ